MYILCKLCSDFPGFSHISPASMLGFCADFTLILRGFCLDFAPEFARFCVNFAQDFVTNLQGLCTDFVQNVLSGFCTDDARILQVF